MIQDIYLIDNDKTLFKTLNQMFKQNEEYEIKRCNEKELNKVLKNIPTMIILNESGINEDIISVCDRINLDEDNAITPVIVISSENNINRINEILTKATLVFKNDIEKEYLYNNIKNIMQLMYLNRRISPLTGLPGNLQIQLEMKKQLLKNETFYMLYFDLDNFKSYNDVYGFFKGDEIIKLTARTILNSIQLAKCESSFVGHIGGDDFVAILKTDKYEDICQNIVIEFDEEIKKYFTEDDLKKGFLEVINRKGDIENFPLTSLSIGVVEVNPKRFNNVLEIAEAGAQVKHLAKSISGSSYIVDRRKTKEGSFS